MQTGPDALTGRVIAHYQILEKLGEGGMGVVYKARDTHLDRFVAIKVLPPGKLGDPDSKRRFVQEARAASALNHPGIITVHDIASEGDLDFIVMEYLSGKPLDRLIPRRGLPLGEALKYALQIADALASAHAAGIIHRDLKPANILVDDHGTVKLVDFGLAKLAGPPESDDAASTRSAPVRTAESTIVGTVAYMSPEQAQGKPVDARSDVFSFGAVLYEMVTGRPAFRGDTSMSTLAAVITQNPQPAGADVPRELERIIFRCLRKDPDRRFHHMIDLRVALADLKEESDSGALAVAPSPRRRRRWLPVAALAAAATALIAAIFWKPLFRQTPPEAAERIRVTFDSGLTTDPALSPDGKLVAYASDRAGQGNLDIWIQNLASGERTQLTKDPADERAPSFSPDGSRIVFRSEKQGGGLLTVSALGGGDPRPVATGGHAPRYSPDGSLIAYHTGHAQLVGGLGAELRVVAASGGQPKRVETGVRESWNPLWTGDGKHLLFVGGDSVPQWDWWVVPIAGGPSVPTGTRDALGRVGFTVRGDEVHVSTPNAWIDDSIIFSGQIGDARNLWRLRISPTTWKVIGPPERVTSGTSTETAPTVATFAERGTPAVRVAFASLVSALNVYDLPVDANRGTVLTGEPRRLTSSVYDAQSSLSADGRRLAFVSTRSGSPDIWLKDLESGKETALTSTSADEFGPQISPDGNTVGFQLIENGRWDFFLLRIGSDGQPEVAERVCEDCARVWSMSADGKHLLFGFHSGSGSEVSALFLYDVAARRRTELVKHQPRTLVRARFSPDDRWISFVEITGSGHSRVTIIPFVRGTVLSRDRWIAVTDDKSYHDKPVWSPDGNLLYFTSDRDGFRCIWAQRLDPKTKRPVDPPFDIYHSHSARRSLLNAEILPLELNVAPGRLLFHLGEITGNIWMVQWKTP